MSQSHGIPDRHTTLPAIDRPIQIKKLDLRTPMADIMTTDATGQATNAKGEGAKGHTKGRVDSKTELSVNRSSSGRILGGPLVLRCDRARTTAQQRVVRSIPVPNGVIRTWKGKQGVATVESRPCLPRSVLVPVTRAALVCRTEMGNTTC